MTNVKEIGGSFGLEKLISREYYPDLAAVNNARPLRKSQRSCPKTLSSSESVRVRSCWDSLYVPPRRCPDAIQSQ